MVPFFLVLVPLCWYGLVPYKQRHALLTNLTGIEGAGVFTYTEGADRIVRAVAYRKHNDTQVQFPGGKVEPIDVVLGIFDMAWHMKRHWREAIAARAAFRELQEEIGYTAGMTGPSDLVFLTQSSETTSGTPASWFACKVPYPPAVYSNAEFQEMRTFTELGKEAEKEFRPFNARSFNTLKCPVNTLLGFDMFE